MSKEYHGNLLDTSFSDPQYLDKFRVFAKKKSETNPWTLHGVIVPEDAIETVIREVQAKLVPNEPYYNHFYRGDELIVVFKDKVFKITPDRSTWKDAVAYGQTLGIPDDQLVFEPNRFEGEQEYFGEEHYIDPKI